MALRLAVWRDSRCISMRHEILAVASGCHRVDVDRHPGVELHQVGEPGAGLLVVDSDDPRVYDDLVRRGAGWTG